MRVRPIAAVVALAVAGPAPAFALTQADFLGTWVVRQVVGASDAVPPGNPRRLLGARLRWTATAAVGPDGRCEFRSVVVEPIGNDRLQRFLWGGQTIPGLDLAAAEARQAFGASETQVYHDEADRCVVAVMLGRDRAVAMFSNGYLYLVERARR